MLECALDVHAVLRRPMQYPGGSKVYQEPAKADNKHRQPIYMNIFAEGPMVRLKEYPARDQP